MSIQCGGLFQAPAHDNKHVYNALQVHNADASVSEAKPYDAIEAEYADMASWYDWFWHSYTEGTIKRPLNEVLEEVKRNDRQHDGTAIAIVDVGCGTGAFLKSLEGELQIQTTTNHHNDETDRSFRLIGIEPSNEMLEQARKKFDNHEEDDETDSNNLVSLKRSSAEQLPLNDESANILVSTNAFHFFRDKRRSLQEMKRVLKRDGGTLILTDWCNDYWVVKLYHLLERLSWKNWGFRDQYPSPLTSEEMVKLVQEAEFYEVEHEKYRVRVYWIFFWGMQTVRARLKDE